MTEYTKKDLAVASAILRLIIGSLFLGAALIKVQGGIEGQISYYVSLFEKSIFPLFLVKVHASMIMFVEFTLSAWLISGFKLRAAWITAALTFISLAFGMIFIYKFDVVSDNSLYALVCILGLLLAPYDKYNIGARSE